MTAQMRHHCDRCGQSVFNTVIDGVRVPLVLVMNTGQPADTGDSVDLNGEGVKVPAFIRELMMLPVARIELCMVCVAEVLGTPLVTAEQNIAVVAAGTVGVPADAPPETLEVAEAPIRLATTDSVESSVRMKSRVMRSIAGAIGKEITVEAPPTRKRAPVEDTVRRDKATVTNSATAPTGGGPGRTPIAP